MSRELPIAATRSSAASRFRANAVNRLTTIRLRFYHFSGMGRHRESADPRADTTAPSRRIR